MVHLHHVVFIWLLKMLQFLVSNAQIKKIESLILLERSILLLNTVRLKSVTVEAEIIDCWWFIIYCRDAYSLNK